MSKTKNENSASAGFFQFPRALFTSPKYQSLSAEAKCLYIFMLDRLSVSHKNGWIDDGKVFIYFTLSKVAEFLGKSRNKAIKILRELDVNGGIGLIERKSQGGAKPNIIYIYPVQDGEIFLPEKEVEKVNLTEFKKSTSSGSKNEPPEVENMNPNYNNINYNKNNYNKSNHIPRQSGTDWINEIQNYEEIIKCNIEYDIFKNDAVYGNWFRETAHIITSVVCSKSEYVTIGGESYPHALVKERFLALNSEHVKYVYDAMKSSAHPIRNIRAYIITALFRAKETMGSWYAAKVWSEVGG